jgi:hypothetical protein
MQKKELHYNKEQEETPDQIGAQEVLSVLQQAHHAQGN